MHTDNPAIQAAVRQEMERAEVYKRAALLEANRFLRIEDVASMLGVSARQVQKLIALKKLSFRTIEGVGTRIHAKDLDRDLETLYSD